MKKHEVNFLHTLEACRELFFIGKIQGHFRDENISIDLVDSDKAGDPFA